MRIVEAPFVFVLALAVSVAGCAANPAPREWRPRAAAAQQSSRGGWIRIEAVDASGKKAPGRPLVEGELIALDETAFHVLSRTGLQSVPRALGHKITLVGYGNRAGTLAGWSVAGGISTLSHGAFLLFTAPMWAITGVVASRTERRAGIWHDDELARRYARFPQGLPPGFDPNTLGTLPAPAR